MRDLNISLVPQTLKLMMERSILGHVMQEKALFVVELLFQVFILIINYLKMRMMAG